ncbi:MAG: hypothetical protein M3014_11210 [Chloroflexota bacterium]|nr:hypothetical protein [Chloroflexota bacterium]
MEQNSHYLGGEVLVTGKRTGPNLSRSIAQLVLNKSRALARGRLLTELRVA